MRRLTIFEGPDGSGKTTLAKRFAGQTNALLVHSGAYPGIGGSDRMQVYINAMLPAIVGTQDVVMDRSWHSEVPYGSCGRDGILRLTKEERTRLNNIAALTTDAAMVLCLPSFEVCKAAWVPRAGDGEEYLESLAQLQKVYNTYVRMFYSGTRENFEGPIPMMHFDYTIHKPESVDMMVRTGGNL